MTKRNKLITIIIIILLVLLPILVHYCFKSFEWIKEWAGYYATIIAILGIIWSIKELNLSFKNQEELNRKNSNREFTKKLIGNILENDIKLLENKWSLLADDLDDFRQTIKGKINNGESEIYLNDKSKVNDSIISYRLKLRSIEFKIKRATYSKKFNPEFYDNLVDLIKKGLQYCKKLDISLNYNENNESALELQKRYRDEMEQYKNKLDDINSKIENELFNGLSL